MAILDLPDGRRLDWAVSGPEAGLPLVYHHGTPGSARPFRLVERAAHARGLRLFTYSRPGYGGSTRLPGRDVAAVAADVAALLDWAGVDRCVVAGWSGGGPHALATAAGLPGRVAAALVIAGVGPYDEPDVDFMVGMGDANVVEFGLAIRGEAELRPVLEHEAERLRTIRPGALVEELASLLPEADRAVLDGELGEDLAGGFHEGLRDSADGWVDDDLAFVRPWGFALADIAAPVLLWQGTEDLMVPLAHGRWLADHIPGVTAHLEPGHGHLSIAAANIAAMLDELTAVGGLTRSGNGQR